MRVLIALGGNAMTGPEGDATPQAQCLAVRAAMESVADLLAAGVDVVLTHGNGPQVGNLLVKNEVAASVVPPVPLDWCDAQTQGTIGALILNSLDVALERRGVESHVAALVTRTLVDADDPAFARPSKPVGRYLPRDEAQVLVDHGQTWVDRGERGWRRVVPSPEPRQVLDAPAVCSLIAAGYVVVAAGGGGIPTVRGSDGTLTGVEAVIDKDLAAAVLAADVDADALVIATDVQHAVIGFGTPDARPLHRVTAAELRAHADEGHFASGSMGPKVEAVLRFVGASGKRAVITSLDTISAAVAGKAGTVVDAQ